jgi:hypothetical protein
MVDSLIAMSFAMRHGPKNGRQSDRHVLRFASRTEKMVDGLIAMSFALRHGPKKWSTV